MFEQVHIADRIPGKPGEHDLHGAAVHTDQDELFFSFQDPFYGGFLS